MKSKPAIKLENVSKTFSFREKTQNSFRERAKSFFNKKRSLRVIEALTNINIEVNQGEFFGIIGHNGSGKSTLLKIIIGALKPDKGSKVYTEGKILRLALGMGFDMNLSARHNIYVNGSIMGLTFKEIGNKFDQIVDFAGLQKYVDTPIKFYSSGMTSRLAFAISMHVEADILLIDEYFGGVGDEEFQKKSSKVFEEHILKGKTIVFVSHNMNLISEYCERSCLIIDGESVICDHTDIVIKQYEEYQNRINVQSNNLN